jgi:hypothetical protein
MLIERELEKLVECVYKDIKRMYAENPKQLPTQYFVFKGRTFTQVIAPYPEELQPFVNEMKVFKPDKILFVMYGYGVTSFDIDTPEEKKECGDSIHFYITDLQTVEIAMHADIFVNKDGSMGIGSLGKSDGFCSPEIEPFRPEHWGICTNVPVYNC